MMAAAPVYDQLWCMYYDADAQFWNWAVSNILLSSKYFFWGKDFNFFLQHYSLVEGLRAKETIHYLSKFCETYTNN